MIFWRIQGIEIETFRTRILKNPIVHDLKSGKWEPRFSEIFKLKILQTNLCLDREFFIVIKVHISTEGNKGSLGMGYASVIFHGQLRLYECCKLFHDVICVFGMLDDREIDWKQETIICNVTLP